MDSIIWREGGALQCHLQTRHVGKPIRKGEPLKPTPALRSEAGVRLVDVWFVGVAVYPNRKGELLKHKESALLACALLA